MLRRRSGPPLWPLKMRASTLSQSTLSPPHGAAAGAAVACGVIAGVSRLFILRSALVCDANAGGAFCCLNSDQSCECVSSAA